MTQVNKHLVDFTEIQEDGELWELFSRDFLQEIGFYIENQPNRGADGGKDLLVTEELSGMLNKYRFRWLVSCKNYAKSGKSVTDKDELNLRERLEAFGADGFIGFYSTIASTGLNNLLVNLKSNFKIKDFRIFDSKLIENYLIRLGFSRLLLRYFPLSYRRVKPLHLLGKNFVNLECCSCGADLLESLNEKHYMALMAEVVKQHCIEVENRKEYYKEVIDVYWACKDSCDRKLEAFYYQHYGALTTWYDISDLAIPAVFAGWVIKKIDDIKTENKFYSEKAHKKIKYFFKAMTQKVFREMTEDEFRRAGNSFDEL